MTRIRRSQLNENFGLNEMKLASWWCKGRVGEVSMLISFSLTSELLETPAGKLLGSILSYFPGKFS